MKKIYMRLLLGLLLAFGALGAGAQIAVTVSGTAVTNPALSASYTSLSTALAALNAVTSYTTSGTVVFTCAPGTSETAPATGFVIGSATLNPLLSATNTVTIVQGGGTVTLVAGTGTATPGSAAPDGIISIRGADYITIDGLVLNDFNNSNPASMEFGIGLFKLSATDGANNNTIQNCTFNMQRVNNASGTAPLVDGSVGIGIYNSTATAATTALTVTAASGSNSNNKVYANTINNSNIGIAVIGYAAASPFTLADQNNDIGGSSSAQGNQVLNFGGGGTTSPAAGIRTLAQYGLNVSYNTINNNTGGGFNHASTLRGIYLNTAVSASETITNNTITLKSGGTTSVLTAIENVAGATAASNTVSINSNTITGCTYATATSGAFTGITNTASAATVNINGNQLTNNTTNATSGTTNMISNSGLPTVALNINSNNINGWTFNATTSGTFNGINSSVSPVTATQSINSNNFQAITHAVAGSSAHNYIQYNSATSTTCTVNSNTFTNLNVNTTGAIVFFTRGTSSMTATGSESWSSNSIVTGFNKGGAGAVTIWTAGTGGSSVLGSTMLQNLNNFSNITLTGASAFTGINNAEGAGAANGPVKTITNNTFNAITTGAAQITGISWNYGVTGSSISGNTLTNFTCGTGILSFSSGTANTGIQTISGNTFTNFTAQGQINVVQMGAFTGSITNNISGNTIRTINTSSAANAIYGIICSAGTNNIFKNRIADIASDNAGGTVSGMLVQTAGTYTIYNNLIGDLRTPSATGLNAVQGISVGAGVTVNAYYNTIYLNTVSTSTTTFGTSCISFSSTATSFNSRNNVLFNASVPAQEAANVATNGISAALRRTSGTGGTVPANYATTSNNNAYWANPTAGTNNHLSYAEGTTTITNPMNTVANLKAFMLTRDQFSVQENVSWQSVSASNANFLKYNTGIPSQLESGAVNIATYTDDYTGTVRQGNAGYLGTGSAPDMGAWELEGIASDITPPTITYTAIPNTGCANPPSLSAVITDASGVNVTAGTKPRLYYRKSSNANTLGATNDNTTDGWKYVEASNAASPFSFTFDYTLLNGGVPAAGDVINYFVLAQDLATTPNVGINAGTFTAAPASVALGAGAFPVTGNNTFSIATPIATSVTVGSGGTYATLSATGGLFAAINSGGLSANTTATILGNITETGAVALNQISYGCAGTYTLTIVPAPGITPLLSGSSTTPLIDLNGADYVTFDGSNSGTSSKDLTIRNTGTGPVLRLINDATYNTVKNTIIEGQNATATSGDVFFSTSTGNLGNSNNMISNCDIRDRSDATGVPANALYASGSTGAPNAANTVQNSNIYNYTAGGALVTATGVGDSWNFSGNSFYQTASRSAALTGISILGGNGHAVLNNYIGGIAPAASGSYLVTSSTVSGIVLAVGTTTATSVQGNVVKNIRSTYAAYNSSYGISLTAGRANIGNIAGNTIGSANVAERLELNGDNVGINVLSTSAVNLSNNVVNNMTTSSTVGAGEYYFGIIVDGTAGTHTVVNNTVTNFTNGSTPDISGGYNTQTIGMLVSATGVQTVSGNTITNIGSTSTAASTSTTYLNRVWGMIISATASGTVVEKNNISNIYGSSTGVGSYSDVVTCLQSQSVASGTYRNNMISTTGGASGSRNLNGILDISASPAVSNYYYNTVSISGTATSTVNNYAFNRNNTATVTILNNIFSNTRTGGTGYQVAMANTNAAATGWAATASNYNDLYNTTAANLCQWLGAAAGNNRTLATWQAAQTSGSGGDANSISVLPVFVSATDLHLTTANCGIDGRGTPVGSITTDIDGDTRDAGAPDMGADEFSATLSGSLAIPSGAGTTSVTYNVSPAGTTFANSNCETIARVLPSGGSAIAGSVKAMVTVDASVQTYNVEPYAQRHYDIEPASNAAGSTATITLYFTDADFTNYNAANTGYKNLPTAALGNADPNIANLLVNQYHGTGTVPGTYTGAKEVIDPVDANIVWNSSKNRWEVTFTVTGFSGFYITTPLGAPLPISISYFRGAKQGTANVLDWKVNVVSSPTVTLSLERCGDGWNFAPVYNTTASDTRALQPFTYTDANPLAGINYYRLKMTDANGKVTYSSIVTLLNATRGFEMVNIAPNPVVNGSFKLNITTAQQTPMTVIITDMTGRTISTRAVTLTAGFNAVDMNVTNLAAGTYQLYGNTADGKTRVLSFVKK